MPLDYWDADVIVLALEHQETCVYSCYSSWVMGTDYLVSSHRLGATLPLEQNLASIIIVKSLMLACSEVRLKYNLVYLNGFTL